MHRRRPFPSTALGIAALVASLAAACGSGDAASPSGDGGTDATGAGAIRAGASGVDATGADAGPDAKVADGGDAGQDGATSTPVADAGSPDANALDSGGDSSDGRAPEASAGDSGADACPGDACQPLAAAGAACSSDDACVSGVCGVGGTGHCCITACAPAGGTCGATGCDATGACVFPASTVALPSASQVPGDCQKIVCDGAGGSMPVDDPSDVPVSTTVCAALVCAGEPLLPSLVPAATGTDCSADNDPPNHVCGATTNRDLAGTCVECNTSADCVAVGADLTCDTATGTCQ